jgi:DNA-binding FrmR family transcriptional regulator
MLSISSNNFAPASVDAGSDLYQNLLQKKLETARKNAAAIDGLSSKSDQDLKAAARMRIDEIKKQIEMLKKMLALFGGKDAKAVLQQLKQLASQLKQAAGVLRTSPSTDVPEIPGVPAQESTTSAAASDSDSGADDGFAEGRSAYAAQQASAAADAAPALSPDQQSVEDDKLVESASVALKSLRSTLEKLVKKQEGQL